MKKGILIVSAFLHSPQTDETYRWLLNGAARCGIDLKLMTNADFILEIDTGLIKPSLPEADFILYWNKDVTLGAALEKHGYRLYNPSDAIKACDDKSLTLERLAGIVDMPQTFKIPMAFGGIGYTDFVFIDMLADELGYPFVIKECCGSYGGQVYLATDKEKAVSILKSVNGSACIAEKFISQSYGRDLRAYVVGDRVVAAIERRNPNDFRANIANGGSSLPYKITREQEEMAVTSVKALGLDFAGVDLLFLENDKPILCEVNSNAQFKGLYEATDIDITDAIFEHILADRA